MVKLKTDKAKLGMLKRAHLYDEMKPEYDRMKAKIAEVMAMRPPPKTLWATTEFGVRKELPNTLYPALEAQLKEIKAILGGE